MNLTPVERSFRTALGAVMTTTGLYIHEPFVWIIGAVLLVTGALGFCPFAAFSHVVHGDSPSEYQLPLVKVATKGGHP